MTTVRRLLESKPRDTWTIRPGATAYEALEIMSDKNVGALLVIRDDELVGVFSERDYARKVILRGKSSKNTTVGELMTAPVYFVTPDMTIGDCMALMTDRRVRHLPVMENRRVLGVVSIGDVVNRIITEQQITIRDLESFITGGYADVGSR
ncbi:MAG: CBS domain-containing protein [Candidatus Sulfobium sp.]|jgi:CBS domain-containing protein